MTLEELRRPSMTYRTRDPICCFWLSHFVDSGSPFVDSGPPFVDSGTHFVDSGTHLVDSGRQNGDCHSEKNTDHPDC